MEKYCLYQQQLLNAMPEPLNISPSFFGIYLNKILWGLGLSAYWDKTFYGIQAQINQSHPSEQKSVLLKKLLQPLTETYFGFNHSLKWWRLMRSAVGIMGNFPATQTQEVMDLLPQLMKLCAVAPQPWQGYNVAYSFATLSLWCFRFGKVEKALDYINLAIHADPHWGYPEYLLGWYGLQLEGIDPIPHFARAIHQNKSFFDQLQQDPLCRYCPKIIKAVKQFLTNQTSSSRKGSELFYFSPGQEDV